MFLLSLQLTLIEMAILLAVAVILIITILFFIRSRRTLRNYIQQGGSSLFKKEKNGFLEEKQIELSHIHDRLQQLKQRSKVASHEGAKPNTDVPKDQLIQSLRQTVSQQQKLLTGFLRQVEELEDNGKEELKLENEDLRMEIKNLEAFVDKKDAEIQKLQQQANMAQTMAARVDEIYQEFELLQGRMKELEVQATKANSLEIELEEARESFELARKNLLRKQEKLEEAIGENQDLRNELHQTEDKLSEANRQRQQFQKKVQFMQDLNDDLHNMNETNKKLQTELRRIGELESMLSMIAEERDQLLRKQYNK